MLEEAQTNQLEAFLQRHHRNKIMKEVRKQATRIPGRLQLYAKSLVENNEDTDQNNPELGKF